MITAGTRYRRDAMSVQVAIDFVVPVGHEAGDYAHLHGNGGSGSIDWNTSATADRHELFPHGAGIYGFGRSPWGRSRFGRAHSMRAAGWGHLPFGRSPWGLGTAVVTALYRADSCGEYKFGFKCYDSLGNLHTGSPDDITVQLHSAPQAPTGLTKVSYNKTTDVLVLNAA